MTLDPVFELLQSMLRNSPEASYKRLNPALRNTLANCIEADLPFAQDTFKRVYNELRGNWWFGDGAGSSMGEHFYTLACNVNHSGAQQSFESFAGRPGVLWEENAETPSRLHVGSQFTWKGYYVEVTSMRADSLVACTYHSAGGRRSGIEIGAEVGEYDEPYVVTHRRKKGKGWILEVVPTKVEQYGRVVARRFTIPYEEIKEFRRTEKVRVAAVLKQIAECDPSRDVKVINEAIAAEHFRHFQLEKIRKAWSARNKAVADESRVADWRAGVNGAFLGETQSNLLRVKGDRVECSNGNAVTVASVRRVLPLLLGRRKVSGELSEPLDGHIIKRTAPKGVTVGCTFVAWTEVEYVAGILNAKQSE